MYKIRIEILNEKREVVEVFDTVGCYKSWKSLSRWLRRVSAFIGKREDDFS